MKQIPEPHIYESNFASDEKFMNLALAEASKAEMLGDVPVGSVIVNSKGEVVASGYNQREILNDPTQHAEIVVLQQAAAALKRWRMSDCTLFVTLEPCFMCAGALVQARMGRVVFAAIDAKGGAGGSLANVLNDSRLNHRCIVNSGVKSTEASEMLTHFFRQKRLK